MNKQNQCSSVPTLVCVCVCVFKRQTLFIIRVGEYYRSTTSKVQLARGSLRTDSSLRLIFVTRVPHSLASSLKQRRQHGGRSRDMQLGRRASRRLVAEERRRCESFLFPFVVAAVGVTGAPPPPTSSTPSPPTSSTPTLLSPPVPTPLVSPTPTPPASLWLAPAAPSAPPVSASLRCRHDQRRRPRCYRRR